jgi:hypothetical protein
MSLVFSRRKDKKKEEWQPDADKSEAEDGVEVLHCTCDIRLTVRRKIFYHEQEFSASSLHTNDTFLKSLVRLNQTFLLLLSFTFYVFPSPFPSLLTSISAVLYVTYIILLCGRLVQIPVMYCDALHILVFLSVCLYACPRVQQCNPL